MGRKVKNARFPAKALLALAYGIKEHGFRHVRPIRKGVADHFADASDGYSAKLHIHGEFAEAVAARQRIDAGYFKSEFGVDFGGLFTPRLNPPYSDDPRGEILLTDEDIAWLDEYYSAN